MPCVGSIADNGVVLDETMVKSAAVYVDAVRAASQGAPLAVEQQLTITDVHPECWGTTDTMYYLDLGATGELHIWDLKYGWIVVEAVNNWQLMCYAIGGLAFMANHWGRTVAEIAQRITVVLHIGQPRPYHVEGPIRSWRVPASELLAKYLPTLQDSACKALGPTPECVTGPHCKNCLGRHACVAAQRLGQYAIEISSHSVPCELSPEALSLEYTALLRAQEALKLRITGLETQALAIIGKGGHVPGYTTENGAGRRTWDRPALEIIEIGRLLGHDLAKAPDALTPAQARDRKIPDSVIKGLSSITSTGKKLVPSTKTLAGRVFGPNGVF
jgi:hypothetical protein